MIPGTGAHYYGLGQWTYHYRGVEAVTHFGIQAGQCSLIVRIPSRNTGFWISVNDNDFGSIFNVVVGNMILDDLLGLEPIDWEGRYLVPQLEPKIPLPRKKASRSAPREEIILGTYFDLGYGTINVERLTTSPLANDLTDTFAKAGLNLDPNEPTYVVDFDRIFSSHIVFRHLDGPRFEWIPVKLYTVRDKDYKATGERVGSCGAPGQAVFTDRGVGMFDDWWGILTEGKRVSPVEENVAERAEAWFARV